MTTVSVGSRSSLEYLDPISIKRKPVDACYEDVIARLDRLETISRELLEIVRTRSFVEKEYLSVAEASRSSGMGADVLRRAVRTGRLRAYDVATSSGRVIWKIARKDLRSFVESVQARSGDGPDPTYESRFLGL